MGVLVLINVCVGHVVGYGVWMVQSQTDARVSLRARMKLH